MNISDYFNLFLLFSSAISFLLSIYLWILPPVYFSNRVISVLLLVWGITIAIFATQSDNLYIKFPHILGVGSSLAFLFFPLIYTYIKSYLFTDSRKIKSYLLHFIPFVLFILSISPFYFQSAESKINILRSGFPQWLAHVFNYSNSIVIIQGIVYSLLSIRMLQQFQYFNKKKLSKEQSYSIKWILQFVTINVVLWSIGSVGALMGMLRVPTPIDSFKIYYLGVTILIIRFGYFAIKNPVNFFSDINDTLKYRKKLNQSKKESISPKDNHDLKKILNYIEEEQAYLKKDLSVQNLVEGTGYTKHRISELFNNELHKSFYDIINTYRVNESIRLLKKGNSKTFTLEHIAEKSGFNSKATFYRIFKKNTGNTPNSYIKSISTD